MKKLWIIYGLVAVALIAISLITMLLPENYEKAVLQTQLTTAEAAVAQLQLETTNLPNILKAKNELGHNLRGDGDSDHLRAEVLALLNRIGQQCESHALAISEVRPPVEELIALHESHMQHPDIPQFLNVTLVLDGQYIEFGKFVNELEQSDYFNRVNFVRVKSNPENNRSTQFMIEFKVLLGITPEVAG